MSLTYDLTYSAAGITVAMLGKIEAGRIYVVDTGVEWKCHLLPEWASRTRKACSFADAKRALEARVEWWIGEAKLTQKGEDDGKA